MYKSIHTYVNALLPSSNLARSRTTTTYTPTAPGKPYKRNAYYADIHRPLYRFNRLIHPLSISQLIIQLHTYTCTLHYTTHTHKHPSHLPSTSPPSPHTHHQHPHTYHLHAQPNHTQHVRKHAHTNTRPTPTSGYLNPAYTLTVPHASPHASRARRSRPARNHATNQPSTQVARSWRARPRVRGRATHERGTGM